MSGNLTPRPCEDSTDGGLPRESETDHNSWLGSARVIKGFLLLLSKTFNLEVSLTALGQGGTIWRDT